MIDRLRIRNFKTWKDTTELALAPVTVFFGGNSSGKSSLGQFLMMLKQTARSQDRTLTLLPGGEHTPVDLGTFADVLHNHDLASTLRFSLRFRLPEPVAVTDVLLGTRYEGDALQFESEIAAAPHGPPLPRCVRFEYRLGEADGSGFRPSVTAALVRRPGSADEYTLEATGFRAEPQSFRGGPLTAPYHFYGFPDRISLHYKNASSLTTLSVALQECLEKISYLGPIREFPHRSYTWSGESPPDVGAYGRNWLAAYLAAADRRLPPPGGGRRKQSFAAVVAAWLRELGLIADFDVRKIAGVRSYQVKVRMHPDSGWVHLPDVGFGVSQALPVLVQSLYAPDGGTVIMEQPELHLHPAVQSNLADFFVHTATARAGAPGGPVQFLLESHSEHFLRRLQRRVADETIAPDMVAVYFCSADDTGASRIERLEMDEFGNIRNWPPDFFGDPIIDIAEMTRSGNRRRREAARRSP